MRRKLSKTERKIVYDKYNGHCAYCGCEIPFKGFNVDHVLCMRNYEYMDESIDTVGNMLPSCGSCNRYKSTYDLETFRRMLSGIPRRLARDVGTYNIAVRYGMVEEHHGPVRFYFEKAVSGQPETGGWIPCSERMPEEDQRVIACFAHGTVTELRFHDKKFHGLYDYDEKVITAWQPMPEAYHG